MGARPSRPQTLSPALILRHTQGDYIEGYRSPPCPLTPAHWRQWVLPRPIRTIAELSTGCKNSTSLPSLQSTSAATPPAIHVFRRLSSCTTMDPKLSGEPYS